MISSTRNKIKVGVIGCGYWGSKIIRNLCDLEQVSLEQVCDLDMSKLKQIFDLYPFLKITTQFEKLLASDLDAIIIATPTITHYKLAKLALQADKHILVEKPLTIDSSQAKEIIKLAQSKNLILLVGHIFEYDPNIQKIANLIANNQLGDIYYIDSVRGNFGLFRDDVDVIWDLAIHDLSICKCILNSRPLTITATGKSCINIDNKKIYDVATLTLEYPQEILATVRVSWLEPKKTRKLTIIGNSKMLVYDPIETKGMLLYDQKITVNQLDKKSPDTEILYHYGDTQHLSISDNDALRSELDHFVKCIQGTETPKTCGLRALETINILETAQKSLINNSIKESINYDNLLD